MIQWIEDLLNLWMFQDRFFDPGSDNRSHIWLNRSLRQSPCVIVTALPKSFKSHQYKHATKTERLGKKVFAWKARASSLALVSGNRWGSSWPRSLLWLYLWFIGRYGAKLPWHHWRRTWWSQIHGLEVWQWWVVAMEPWVTWHDEMDDRKKWENKNLLNAGGCRGYDFWLVSFFWPKKVWKCVQHFNLYDPWVN